MVANAVLRTLSSKEFQDVAKKHATEARKQAFDKSLEQFAKIRPTTAADSEYAQSAVNLQSELKTCMQSLEAWLSQDLARRAGETPWLTEPPHDLNELLKDLPELRPVGSKPSD